jgi:hypothetical protein
MADKTREDRPPVAPATANPSHPVQHGESGIRLSSRRTHHPHRKDEASTDAPVSPAYLETIGAHAAGEGDDAERRPRASTSTSTERTIRSVPAVYRWVCPCQDPPVLLATYGPNARINIKVRDRYWHLHGFGMVEAICPRCAAEHLLDLRHLHRMLDGEDTVRRSS